VRTPCGRARCGRWVAAAGRAPGAATCRRVLLQRGPAGRQRPLVAADGRRRPGLSSSARLFLGRGGAGGHRRWSRRDGGGGAARNAESGVGRHRVEGENEEEKRDRASRRVASRHGEPSAPPLPGLLSRLAPRRQENLPGAGPRTDTAVPRRARKARPLLAGRSPPSCGVCRARRRPSGRRLRAGSPRAEGDRPSACRGPRRRAKRPPRPRTAPPLPGRAAFVPRTAPSPGLGSACAGGGLAWCGAAGSRPAGCPRLPTGSGFQPPPPRGAQRPLSPTRPPRPRAAGARGALDAALSRGVAVRGGAAWSRGSRRAPTALLAEGILWFSVKGVCAPFCANDIKGVLITRNACQCFLGFIHVKKCDHKFGLNVIAVPSANNTQLGGAAERC